MFVAITDEVTEGVWLNPRGSRSSIKWDPEAPERANSEDRDYLAVKGETSLVGQAFTANETGPDITCSRIYKPWNYL